jgi:hypothetical protein
LFGPILFLAVTVLITHPITFLLLAAGIFSQSFAEKGLTPSMIFLVGGLLSLALIISAFWPYFSMVELLLGESSVYNASNRGMYSSVLSRIWSSLIGLPLIIPAIVIIFALILTWKPLERTLANSLRARPTAYKNYLFLSRFAGQYDVVLSDIKSSWILPTFGGKVVAAIHPLAFVPDHDIRRSDLDSFFNRETTFTERQRIIHKYNTNYLLLNKSKKKIWRDLRQSFMTRGRVVFESDSFILISFKPK